MRRLLTASVLLVLVVLGTAAPAAAHADLVSTSPTSGAALQGSPEAVELRFTEPVEAQPGAIKVFDTGGGRIDDGSVSVDGVVVRMPVDLDDGGYVVTYRVVSTDGHPIGGGFTFRVGQGSEDVDAALFDDLLAGAGTDPVVGIVAGIVRFLAFAGLVVLIGGTALVAWLWPAGRDLRRVRHLLLAALTVLALATTASIGLQAADVAGLGLADAVGPTVVGEELSRRFGLLALARLLLLVPASFLLLALFRGAGRTAWWRASAAAIAVGMLAVTALNGHAASGRWQAAALVADVVHLLAASMWLGGLAVLVTAVLRHDDEEEAAVVVGRFSRVAFAAVALLVVTGAFQSVRQVGSLDGLDTGYGRLLLAKLLAVGGLVALAALSRQVVRHRLGEDGGIDELRRSVGIEAVVAVVVLAVTALLVDAEPGRDEALTPVSVSRVVEGVVIDVEVVPAVAGPNDIHVYAQDPQAGLTDKLEATAVLSLPGGGVEGLEVPLVRAGRGHWSAYDFDLPIPAEWVLAVRIVGPQSFVETEVEVPVR